MEYVTLVPSSLSAEQYNATYSCSLTNTWSNETHPVLYDTIASSAHWSSPVLVTHSKDFDLWEPDTLASPGVENVAEMGYTGPIRSEIMAAHASGLTSDFAIGTDQMNSLERPQTFDNLVLTPDFPLLSTITMMSPSPDWFTGIPGFSPIDRIDRVWYEFFELATYPWDAGTKKGRAYNGLGSISENPHKPISQMTIETAPENGILVNPSNTTILPVALWSCSLQLDIPSEDSGHCRHYFEECTESSHCCWGYCVDGFCKNRQRSKNKRSRESLRLSNQAGGVVGGAAGRDKTSSMMVEGKSFLDDMRESWLRGSEGGNQ